MTQFRWEVARCSERCMLGRATFTIVSSSTSMSCAVAMTSRARPSLRFLTGSAGEASPVRFWTDMPSRLSQEAGVPDVEAGVLRPPLFAEGGEQRRRELAEDRVQHLRARPVEQPRHVHRRVTADPFGMDLS